MALLEAAEAGLYCAAGDFYIDPWMPVDRAVITHGHSDHCSVGSRSYLTSAAGGAIVRARLGPEAVIETVPYGERIAMGSTTVSLHPAGHILGSAQVRIESAGEVWVVSGDYKLAPDPTCAPFEPLRCHTFVTESTFGLPIFRWDDEAETLSAINAWWRANREAGKSSLLFAYPLGKAQRILCGVDPSIASIYAHGAVDRYSEIYRGEGVRLPEISPLGNDAGALILAPVSAHNSPWTRRFPGASTAFASGWMRIRGPRRRRSLDRGFVLSDHADWAALLQVIDATEAETVWVTHGFRAPLVRWLEEHGRRAVAVETHFEEEPEA